MLDDNDGTEFILQLVESSIDKQMDWVDSLDKKVIAILTLSSGLMAALGSISALLAEQSHSWRLLVLTLPGAAYIAGMFFVWLAFKPRKWGRVPNPHILVEDWLHESVPSIRAEILKTIASTYQKNEDQIDSKAGALAMAARLVPIQTTLIVVSLVVLSI